MADLKPCPCCAGAATFDHDDHGWNWIECQTCGLSTNSAVSHMDDCKPVLAECWNLRATEAEATGKQEVGVPDGWKLVPAKPTASMLYELMSDGEKDAARGMTPAHAALLIELAGISYRYDAMLAAAQSATVDVAASGSAFVGNDGTGVANATNPLAGRSVSAGVASVPEGYALVPIEPTAEMQHAAALAVRFKTTPLNRIWIGNAAYRAAVAAAPTPSSYDSDWEGMFKDAAHSLSLIDAALGIDQEEAGGANPILEAIEKLKDAPTPTAPDDVARDAERYRWLQRQRTHVWHEVAGLRMNHTDDFIDAAIAASKEPT